jgi:hypothetical protein
MLPFPYVRAIVSTEEMNVVGVPIPITGVSAPLQTRVAMGRLNPGTSSPLNVLPVRKAQ